MTTERLLSITVTMPVPGVQLVQVFGELDMQTKPRLMTCLDDVLKGCPRHLVLDLSGVGFLAVSGMGALVSIRDCCADRGVGLHITGATHSAVARPMELVQLDQILPVLPTWKDALAVIAA